MPDTTFDLIAMGRACVDLNAIEYNQPLEETASFAKFVGGSPANIAIGSARLGQRVGFIGKVSKDQLGNYVRQYMRGAGVDVSHIVDDKAGHSIGLCFTEILSPSESDILLIRNEAADLYLSPNEVDEQYLSRAKLLLVSGTALAQSPSREAVIKAILLAKSLHIEVVLELDYRPYTWRNAEETSLYYRLVAEHADIVIGTRDEFDVLEHFVDNSNEQTARQLLEHDTKLVIIKVGVQGSFAYTDDGQVFRGHSIKSKVLKSFGAGDSFASAFLYAYQHGLGIDTALQYGAASASIVISQLSCSEAMPTLSKIQDVIAHAEIIDV